MTERRQTEGESGGVNCNANTHRGVSVSTQPTKRAFKHETKRKRSKADSSDVCAFLFFAVMRLALATPCPTRFPTCHRPPASPRGFNNPGFDHGLTQIVEAKNARLPALSPRRGSIRDPPDLHTHVDVAWAGRSVVGYTRLNSLLLQQEEKR